MISRFSSARQHVFRPAKSQPTDWRRRNRLSFYSTFSLDLSLAGLIYDRFSRAFRITRSVESCRRELSSTARENADLNRWKFASSPEKRSRLARFCHEFWRETTIIAAENRQTILSGEANCPLVSTPEGHCVRLISPDSVIYPTILSVFWYVSSEFLHLLLVSLPSLE